MPDDLIMKLSNLIFPLIFSFAISACGGGDSGDVSVGESGSGSSISSSSTKTKAITANSSAGTLAGAASIIIGE